MFLQGKALRVQLDLRRYGPCWGPAEAAGKVPSAPRSRLLSPLQVSHLLQAVCAGVASGEQTRASPGGPASLASPQPQHGAGSGRGRASQDTPSSPPSAKPRHARPGQAGLLPLRSPRLLFPQLFSLQAPLKTLLQLTIMPIINGRHHRCPHTAGLGAGAQWDSASLHLSLPAERTKKGVQIPLPEGMDFTKEVVTNHAVRGGMGTAQAPPSRRRDHVLLGQGAVTPSLALILFPFPGIPHGGSRSSLLQGAAGGD